MLFVKKLTPNEVKINVNEQIIEKRSRNAIANQSKGNRNKEIIQIREEINEIQSRLILEKISKAKVGSLKRLSKLINPLA